MPAQGCSHQHSWDIHGWSEANLILTMPTSNPAAQAALCHLLANSPGESAGFQAAQRKQLVGTGFEPLRQLPT